MLEWALALCDKTRILSKMKEYLMVYEIKAPVCYQYEVTSKLK